MYSTTTTSGMSSEDILSCVKAIIYDNDTLLDESSLDSRHRSILMTLGIYLHAYKCVQKLYTHIYFNASTWSYFFKVAILSDNDNFFNVYSNNLDYYSDVYVKGLYYSAMKYDKTKVVLYLKKYLNSDNVNNILPAKLIKDKLLNIIIEFKNEYDALQDIWNLEREEYDNVIQWLPRELIEDQMEYHVRALSDFLYNYK